MTDPTTRYPLPDEPGSDPLAVSPASSPPPAEIAPSTTAGPPPPPPPTATGTGPPPPSAPPPSAPRWSPSRGAEPRWPAIVFGLILIGIGLWFFAEVTLGLDLPAIRWGQLWPVILIVIGGLILYGSRLGRSR